MNDFARLFGRSPTVTTSAPGRVNLMGEHTDYNGGLVLPAIIPQRTVVELVPSAQRRVRAVSVGVAPSDRPLEYVPGDERAGRGWLDYVQGVTHVLATAGFPVGGFDLRVTSDVPVGSGLSSSAALLVAVLRALRVAFALALDDVALAGVAQQAESTFVGVRVGIMDQMAASLGEEGSALFLDTRTRAWERVAVPPAVELAVIDSGVAHRHVGGDYNTRRDECERACRLLGVGQLRDLDEADLPRLAMLPAPLARRARHVVTENARVLAAVAALRAGDAARLGTLFTASHVSQRDDYEVSVPEVDLLVDLARGDAGVYGARLTGGGFGGSVVLAVRRGTAHAVAHAVADRYAARTARVPAVHVPPLRP